MNPTTSFVRALAASLAMLLATGVQAAAPEPTDVIAESARARVTVADYEAEIARLPAGSRAEFAASQLRLKLYLDNLYIARVLAADARAEGLDKDPVLARQIAVQVEKLLAQAKVERIEAAAAAEFDKSADKYTPRVRELYDVNRAKYAVPEQVRAHILVTVKGGKADEAKRKAEECARRRCGPTSRNLRSNSRMIRPCRRTAANWASSRPGDGPRVCGRRFRDDAKGEISAPVRSHSGTTSFSSRIAGPRAFAASKRLNRS